MPPRDPDDPTAPSDRDDEARPVAVGTDEDDLTAPPRADAPDHPADAPDPADDASGDVPAGGSEAPAADRPWAELGAGVAALGLAGSVFLTWYADIAGRTWSGWSSGTAGPVVFVVAVFAAAIVALRRANIAISLPWEPPVMLEFCGWVALAALFVKRFVPLRLGPDPIPVAWPWVASVVLAGGLVFLAGAASKTSLYAPRPGWLRARGGTLGAALLGVTVVAAAVLAFAVRPASGEPKRSPREEGVPACMREAGFPVPRGVLAISGQSIEIPGGEITCAMTLVSEARVGVVQRRFERALADAGWTHEEPAPTEAGGVSFALRGPRCGILTIGNPRDADAPDRREIKVITGACHLFGAP